MSKSVIARGYASAAQATMAFAPTVELLTSPISSFSPQESSQSKLFGSPLLSPNSHSHEYQSLTQTDSLMSDSHIDQITGRELYSLLCLSSL